jgi:hypothetical protein
MGIFIFIVIIVVVIIAIAAMQPDKMNPFRELIKTKVETIISNVEGFNQSHKYISSDYSSIIAFDDTNNKICLLENTNPHPTERIDNTIFVTLKEENFDYNISIFDCKDFLQSEVIVDGESVTKTSRGSQIGGAIIGGILTGGVGAIIGGLSGKKNTTDTISKIHLQITVNDTTKPVRTIMYIDEKKSLKKDNPKYKEAHEKAIHWHNLISVLIKRADDNDKLISQTSTNSNKIDELSKLAQLRKEGILTEEEFIKEKQILLG